MIAATVRFDDMFIVLNVFYNDTKSLIQALTVQTLIIWGVIMHASCCVNT